MTTIDKAIKELSFFLEDTSDNGVSETCGIIITLLRGGSLKVSELCCKTIFLPNNASMREWKEKKNIDNVIRAHIRDLPLSVEKDASKVDGLTRTWSLPIKVKSLNSVVLIIPLVLHANIGRVFKAGSLLEGEFKQSKSMKKSKSRKSKKSKSKSRKSKKSKSRKSRK